MLLSHRHPMGYPNFGRDERTRVSAGQVFGMAGQSGASRPSFCPPVARSRAAENLVWLPAITGVRCADLRCGFARLWVAQRAQVIARPRCSASLRGPGASRIASHSERVWSTERGSPGPAPSPVVSADAWGIRSCEILPGFPAQSGQKRLASQTKYTNAPEGGQMAILVFILI